MNTGQNVLSDQTTSRHLLFANNGQEDGKNQPLNNKTGNNVLMGQVAGQLDYNLHYAANNQQQISSTLFIMDCQTFGIFNN